MLNEVKEEIMRRLELLLGILMIITAAALVNNYKEQAVPSVNSKVEASKDFCVVLDAGHGGEDSGKVGINHALEKDINLKIVLLLKKELEKEKIKVILTRKEDNGLHTKGSTNKKIEDLNERCNIIEKANADLAVSVHQNSYHEESISGPQVFYYKTSEKGKLAAQFIQESFDDLIGSKKNTRKIKSNDNYYLLLHTKTPIVICECGFLSNTEEANQLITQEYQEKIAKCVASGIIKYKKEN